MRKYGRAALISILACSPLLSRPCLATEYQVPGAFLEVRDLINNTTFNSGDIITVSNRDQGDPGVAYQYFDIPSGVTVQNAPSQSPIVEAKDPSGQPTDYAVSFPAGAAANTILMGIGVRGGGLPYCLVDLRGAGKIVNCYIEGDGYTAVLCDGATGTIDQTTITEGDPSVQVLGNSDLTITGCTVNAGRVAIEDSDVSISGTALSGPQEAIEVLNSNVAITDGSLTGPLGLVILNSGVDLDGTTISASNRGIEWTVGQTGSVLNVQNCAFTGTVGSESAIYIMDYTYRLPVINISNTNLTGWAAGVVSTGGDLTIVGCTVDTAVNGICIINADAISVTDCRISNQSGVGIWLTYDPPPAYPYMRDDVSVSDCILTSSSTAGVGMLLDGSSTSTITRYPSLVSNSIVGWGLGLWLNEIALISGTEIRNNLVTLCETAGIVLGTPQNSGITCNDSWGNGGCFSEDPMECPNYVDNYNQGYDISNLESDPLLCGDPLEVGGEIDVRIDSPCSSANGTCGQIGAGLTTCAYGILRRNTTVAANEIHVLDDVLVPAGLELTLQSGATMKFADDSGLADIPGGNDNTRAELLVEGTLSVLGDSENAVYFDSDKANPAAGDWYGIELQGAGTATLSHLTVSHSKVGLSSTSTATMNLNWATVQDADTCLSILESVANASIDNCTFQSGNCGVFVGDGEATVTNSTVDGCGTGIIVAGNGSIGMPSDDVIKNCDIGVWSEDAGVLDLGMKYQTNQDPWVMRIQTCSTLGVGMSSSATGFLEQVSIEGTNADNWTGIHVLPGAQASIVRCEVRDANGAFPIGVFVEGAANIQALKVSNISPPGPNQYGVGLGFASPVGIAASMDRADHLGPMWRYPQLVNCHSGIQVMGDSEPVVRNSEIADNAIGVEISPAAIPDLGLGENGNNSITGSSRLAWGPSRLPGVPNVPAAGNWWGSDPPNPAKISSWVDYYGYLHSQPTYAQYAAIGVSRVLEEPNASLAILSAFPMPFSDHVDISVSIPTGEQASVLVCNVAGARIRSLDRGLHSGETVLHWDGRLDDGRRAASGVYYLKLVTERETVSRTLILVR